MPRATGRSITVFHVGDQYLFTHYFDRTDIFATLQTYYDDEAYRFEVPAGEFEAVRDDLEAAGFELFVVEDLLPYCVVTEKYDSCASILRNAVLSWERRGHRFFLLESKLAVSEALDDGATKLSETEFALGL